MTGISANGSVYRSRNPFMGFLVIVLGGLIISSLFCVTNKPTNNAPIPWYKTDKTYICPKCSSIDISIRFHRKDQVCSCLGRPCDIDHLEVDCKRCGYSSYDPK